MKYVNLYIVIAVRIPISKNTKKTTFKYTTVKLLKNNGNEINIKSIERETLSLKDQQYIL